MAQRLLAALSGKHAKILRKKRPSPPHGGQNRPILATAAQNPGLWHQKRGIPVREEPVALLHRMGIDLANTLLAHKG